ncbi:hypothetical protein BCAH1134_A0081 [Bacillus cereus AH1134]|nr:hypothetical protein BCAH1134_A0081 [Bacillus cereus AH1134]
MGGLKGRTRSKNSQNPLELGYKVKKYRPLTRKANGMLC